MKPRGLISIAIVTGGMAFVPLIAGSDVALNFLIFALIVTLGAQGWNILGGYGGQFSFGHAAFFGAGAYATAILQLTFGVNAWIGFIGGIAYGTAVGLLIGFLSFRSGLRGSYFALVTLAYAEVMRILANTSPITGGASGMLIPIDIAPANFQFANRSTFYFLVLGCVAATLVLTRYIENSRFGAWLVAIRENEDAAKALGVNTLLVKMGAVFLSAAITAAAGCLYVQYFLYVDANIGYGPWISIEVLLAPIVGGAGTVFGPLIGTLTMHGLGELTKSFAPGIAGIDMVLFGILLILVIAFARDGVLGACRRILVFFDRARRSLLRSKSVIEG